MPVGLLVDVVVRRCSAGSLGCLRRTWRADAIDRAGDVCSRKSLAFDEGRRGRGWRLRAAVASPHRITAATLSSSPVFCSLSLFFLFGFCFLFFNPGHPLTDSQERDSFGRGGKRWIKEATLSVRLRGLRMVFL